jgi:hypothetical protein
LRRGVDRRIGSRLGLGLIDAVGDHACLIP